MHKLRTYFPVKSIILKTGPEEFLRFPDTDVAQIKSSIRVVGYSTYSSHSIQGSIPNYHQTSTHSLPIYHYTNILIHDIN